MRILITTDTYKPVINGVVTSIENLSNQLEELGHEVRILTLSNQKNSWKDENVYHLGSFKVDIYPNARIKSLFRHEYLREILDWCPDIIHSQSEFSIFFLAKKIARKLNIPILHTYHTLYADYTHYFIKSEKVGQTVVAHASKLLLNRVDAAIAPTDKVRKTLMEYGVENEIYTVPTGIDLEKFGKQHSEESRNRLKRQYGIGLNEKVLISVGRLGKEKNISELIEYMKLLSTNRKDVTLLLVGSGPEEISLKKQAAEQNLEDKVIFTGSVPQEKIADYYQLGDIFVSASTSETQGLTYIEAMASGLPLICKKDDCLNGVLVEGYNGYSFEGTDDFLQCAAELLDFADHRENMGVQSKVNVKIYSKEHFAKTLEHIYEAIILTKEMARPKFYVKNIIFNRSRL